VLQNVVQKENICYTKEEGKGLEMKKRFLVGSIVLVVIVISIILIGFNKNEIVIESKKKTSYYTNSISMNYETEVGSGIYEEVTNSDWPLKGYIFNGNLSKCEKGSEISWDAINKRVQVSSITSDKCYVYFDKSIPPKIVVSSTSSSASSVTINVTGTKGTNNIAKYMYSIDNKATWVTKTTSATTSSHTFNSLTSNKEYTIYIKVIDIDDNEAEISTKVRTGIPAATTIKNLYTSQGANGLYYHNSSLTNSANDNSYRYSGANPNNWVCFGTTATTCDNEHLYRIIGVFGDQLKLIKAYEGTQTSLGTAAHGNSAKDDTNYKGNLTTIPSYYWSGSKTNESNVWSASTLNTGVLNGTYLTKLGTTWSSMIATTTWKVGGNSRNNIELQQISTAYKRELITPEKDTTYQSKIGLMYVSDYGYGVIPSGWTRNLSDYDYDTNINNNWLYLGVNEWFITPTTDIANHVNVLSSSGFTTNGDSYYYVKVVIPCFYLNSSVGITSGEGTKTNPYRVV